MKLIPLDKTADFEFFSIQPDDIEIPQTIPLFESTVSAGFPSPANDYIELSLDFNSYLISKPYSTFAVKVLGDSMRDANILEGDILIVDKSETPSHNKIVIAIVNGEFTVKRLSIQNNGYSLVPENSSFKTIHILPSDEFEIWGVVTYIIHKAI